MIRPPALKKGDTIAIIASAGAVKLAPILHAKQALEKEGYVVELGEYLENPKSYFPTTDENKIIELQAALDNKNVKAILFARGGYGSVRIIDSLNFKKFTKNPKWLVGFSDITVFHMHAAAQLKLCSLHAVMPNSYEKSPKTILTRTFNVLKGGQTEYNIRPKKSNILGSAKGKLIGGNLSIIHSLVGSSSFPKTKNRILFIEEIGEYLYHIDRMVYTLKRAGHLKNLSGLLIGGFTGTKDTKPSFSTTLQGVILDHVKEYNYPVVFGVSSGHIRNNNPLIMGAKTKISCEEKSVTIKQV